MKVKKISHNIYFFIGTTAELIKLAPVIRELELRKINFKIITTGQTKVNFDELSYYIKVKKADIELNNKVNKSSLLFFAIWILKTLIQIPLFKKHFNKTNRINSYFIVHGDTVSSLIGALFAKYYNFKLVHVESGLRSFSFFEPFPEEICRLIVSKLADIHFCPNQWSVDNLSKAGGIKVNTFQNTLIETTMDALKEIKKRKDLLKLPAKKYFVMIVHRQEHVIFGKEESMKTIKYIVKNINDELKCVFITHLTTVNFLKNSNSKLISDKSNKSNKITLAPRLRYLDFINLINNSEFLTSDGGANQEETYYLGIPCLILRNKSERIEGLSENSVLSKMNKLTIKTFMKDYKKYKRDKVNYFKRPSKIIVDYLVSN